MAERGLVSSMDDIASVLSLWGKWQLAQSLSPKTISGRSATVRQLLEKTGAGPLGLTAEHIVAFISDPGLSRSTRSTYYSTIKAYCGWLVRTHRRVDDPTAEVPSPRRPKGRARPVTPDQFARILAAANRRRTRAMVLLAALGGLRVHEIAKFSGTDIDWEAQAVYVTGKGGNTAILPLHQDLLELARGFPAGYWFPSYKRPGQHITANGVSKAIKSAMKRAGVRSSPHALRHYYGTTLLHNGANLRIVQELMRHESIATTQIYTEVNFIEMRRAIASLRVPA